ncbi:MAG: hypothetical protein ACKVXR_02190 [Planctomycetota bacterium]
MSSTVGFLVFLALTLAGLGCTVATGLRARRRWHITFVAASLACLATTIYFAKELGNQFDLESAGVITPIHLTMAKVTTALYLLPIATGITTIFRPAVRRWHRRVAFLVLAMTVLTAITGTTMILMATPIG